MAAQQELISAVRSMQANAQASLPVIPNNGNPNGAYNAPRQVAQQPVPAKKGFDLSWLQPSTAMIQMQENLSRRQGYLDDMLTQIRADRTQATSPPSAQAPQLAQPQRFPTTPLLPAIPVPNVQPARNIGVVLPSTSMNTGISLPTAPSTGVAVPLPRTM